MAKTTIGTNSQFTGTSQALSIIGIHAYGYSGDVTCTNGAPGTLFNFTTGTDPIMMRFTLIVDRSLLGTNEIGYNITLNGQSVANYRMPNTNNTQDLDALVYFLPPFSNVLIQSETDDEHDITTNGILTGRVYV